MSHDGIAVVVFGDDIDLRVGQQVFDLRFWRDGPATRFEVLKGDATCVGQRSYATKTARWI